MRTTQLIYLTASLRGSNVIDRARVGKARMRKETARVRRKKKLLQIRALLHSGMSVSFLLAHEISTHLSSRTLI